MCGATAIRMAVEIQIPAGGCEPAAPAVFKQAAPVVGRLIRPAYPSIKCKESGNKLGTLHLMA